MVLTRNSQRVISKIVREIPDKSLEEILDLSCTTSDCWIKKIKNGYVGMQTGNLDIVYVYDKKNDMIQRLIHSKSNQLTACVIEEVSVEVESLRKRLEGNFRKYFLFSPQYLDPSQKYLRESISLLNPHDPDPKIINWFEQTNLFWDSAKI